MSKFTSSALWQGINQTILSAPETIDLNTFRDVQSASYANARIAGWDLASNGVRFFKTLLFHEAKLLTEEDWDVIRKTKNRLVGAPLTVTVNGCELCVDYLQSALEVKALRAVATKATRFLEIGAGFGRTAHALLDHFPAIANYIIIDLAPCLVLARRYLERVLDEAVFSKLTFINAETWDGQLTAPVDVAINIDSFAEMDAAIVDNYLEIIATGASAFYCKNPIAKYSPQSMGLPAAVAGKESALAAGKLRDVIDVFDETALKRAIPSFHRAYQPLNWEVVIDGFATPWHYYYEALYRRRS